MSNRSKTVIGIIIAAIAIGAIYLVNNLLLGYIIALFAAAIFVIVTEAITMYLTERDLG